MCSASLCLNVWVGPLFVDGRSYAFVCWRSGSNARPCWMPLGEIALSPAASGLGSLVLDDLRLVDGIVVELFDLFGAGLHTVTPGTTEVLLDVGDDLLQGVHRVVVELLRLTDRLQDAAVSSERLEQFGLERADVFDGNIIELARSTGPD